MLGAASALTRESDGGFNVSGYSGVREAILDIGSRHPLRESDAMGICASLGDTTALAAMLEEGVLVEVNFGGEAFLLPNQMMRMDSTSTNVEEET